MINNTLITPIEPADIITKTVAFSFTVVCQSLTLFSTASFIVSLRDENENIINTQLITLSTEQYQSWNNNDEYIITLVASILGVTPTA